MNKNSPKINVIFRSCDTVNAVHHAPRPFGLDKKTLIKVCFKSLYNSLQGYNYSIIVVGDNLSQEMKDFFSKFDLKLIEGVYGNDASIRETIKIAAAFPDNEWIYFCEDDYLHRKEAVDQIVNLIQNKDSIVPARIQYKQLLRKREITLFSFKRYFRKPDLVIHPCDYPDRYNLKYATKSFIFHTQKSHWRQIFDTTFTFLMEAKDVKRYKKTLLKASNRANDRYLSKALFGKSFFFSKLLCVSPMPSLSSHMHIETMSPIIDWEKIVQQLITKV